MIIRLVAFERRVGRCPAFLRGWLLKSPFWVSSAAAFYGAENAGRDRHT